MEKIIYEAIKKFGETERKNGAYKESTIKTYVSLITNLNLINGGDPAFTDLEWLKDHKKVDETLLKESIPTRRNYVNAIVVALNTQDPKNEGLLKLYEMRRDILNDAVKKQKTNGLTKKQQEVFDKVPKDQFLKWMKDLKLDESNFNEYMMGMVLKIHERYPFRNELAEMSILGVKEYYRVANGGTDHNWCVVGRMNGHPAMKFVLNVYKTSKQYGQRVIELPADLVKIIMDWMIKVRGFKKFTSHTPPEPLLCWKTGNAINRNELSHKLSEFTNKHLGAKISTTLLAKYFNEEIDTNKPFSTDQLFEMDRRISARGHSLSTNLTEYGYKSQGLDI
jgi:hypothetical protein